MSVTNDEMFCFFCLSAQLFAHRSSRSQCNWHRRCLHDREASVGSGQTTHAKQLARAGPSEEFARTSLRSGVSASRFAVPTRGKESSLAAIDLAVAKVRSADHRSAKADMLAARDGGGAARQRASKRMKDAASAYHRPPISMPRTTRWQRREPTGSTQRSWCPSGAVAQLRMRGETSVLSTATWAPAQSGRPLAMTSIRCSSRRAGTTRCHSVLFLFPHFCFAPIHTMAVYGGPSADAASRHAGSKGR